MISELTPKQIETFLREQIIGRLACYADDLIYVVPVTYAYDGNYIYGRTHEGMKMDMIRKNAKVCFEVDFMENFANWKSVIVWGEFEELKGKEAIEAMLFFSNRLKPFMVSETAHSSIGISDIHSSPSSKESAIIYRIKPSKKTGRTERRSNV